MTLWLLRLHRWMALTFALPLLVLTVTGLILSFEPIAIDYAASGHIAPQRVLEALQTHDPSHTAQTLFLRAYANAMSIGLPRQGLLHIDLATNQAIDNPGRLATLFSTARRLHEHLIALDWLVIASTIVMLGVISAGALMGWPRLRRSLSGWHQGAAWITLPLLLLSPVTGLLMASGVSLVGPSPPPRSAETPLAIADAVRVIGKHHDLARLTWIRQRAGATTAQIDDGGEMRVFRVRTDGLAPAVRNWPRLIHEGNWMRAVPAVLNAVTACVLLLLLGTGLMIWAKRRSRRRALPQSVASTENASPG